MTRVGGRRNAVDSLDQVLLLTGKGPGPRSPGARGTGAREGIKANLRGPVQSDVIGAILYGLRRTRWEPVPNCHA